MLLPLRERRSEKEIQSLCILAGVDFGTTQRRHYQVNLDWVVPVQSGQSITRSFVGVVTSSRQIRYRSKRKGRRYRCTLRCLQRQEFALWRISTWTRL